MLRFSSSDIRSPLLLVVALSAVLSGIWFRTAGLGRESVWHDEAHSALMARLEPREIVAAAATADNNPPLYYLLLHWLTPSSKAENEQWLRAPSVVFGLLGLIATFLVAATIGGVEVGLWAAALLALAVFHIQYSREARMYTLLYAATTLSMYFFLKLRGGELSTVVLWMICTVATVFTHTVGIFMIPAQHACWITLRVVAPQAVPPLRRWLPLNVAVAAAVAPWAWVVLRQQRRMGGVFWISRPYLTQPLDILTQLAGTRTLLVLLAGLACVGMVAAVRKKAPSPPGMPYVLVLLIWGAVPLLMPWLVSYVSIPILIPRIAIASLAPLVIAAAFGLAALRTNVAIVAAAAVLLLSAHSAWRQTQQLTKEDWRGLVSYVEPQLTADDLVLFHESSRRKGFQFYSPEPISRVAGFPAHPFGAGETIRRSELPELRQIVAGHPRVWLVLASSNDPQGLMQETLLRDFTMSERRVYRRLVLERFDRR